jgi:hypothetical protein
MKPGTSFYTSSSGLQLVTLTWLLTGVASFQHHPPMQQRQLATSSQLSVAAGLPFDANRLNGASSIGGFISVESPTSKNSENDSKVGVLLLNLGGPEKTEDVEGKRDVRLLRDV